MAREDGREVEAVAAEDGIVRVCLCGHGLGDHARVFIAKGIIEAYTRPLPPSLPFTLSGRCSRCECSRVRLVAEKGCATCGCKNLDWYGTPMCMCDPGPLHGIKRTEPAYSTPEWWAQFDRPQGAGRPEVH